MIFEKVLEIVCSRIDEEKEFLNWVSQEIWKVPEVKYKEVHAHSVLTSALSKYGFEVEEHYLLPTAFRAEYVSELDGGPTIAVLLEYDAFSKLGHACGRNLVAEAGLAASIAIKAVMDGDSELAGKLVVLGTPAEEEGGKIKMMELGAFEDIDAAFMVNPKNYTAAFPPCLGMRKGTVQYNENSDFYLRDGSALDAAFICNRSISRLKEQIPASRRFHTTVLTINKFSNVIKPKESTVELHLSAATDEELKELQSRVETCITKAATATGCEMEYHFDQSNCYRNLRTNRVLGHLFQRMGKLCGLDFHADTIQEKYACHTYMGNISHIVPSICPYFRIDTGSSHYTQEFTEVSGSPEAQEPTLAAAKALALTSLEMLRSPDTLRKVKEELEYDIETELN